MHAKDMAKLKSVTVYQFDLWVYASCLGVLKNLATYSFWFTGFKNKNTLHGYIKGLKTSNKTMFRFLTPRRELGATNIQLKMQPTMHL